jgi:arabinose-5-phosphate isomerase
MKELIKETALKTLNIEIEALTQLRSSINDAFVQCVQKVFDSKGRVIITGIGKSAIVAQKIVATLNSTGTPSVFMMPFMAIWELCSQMILSSAFQKAAIHLRLKF